MAKTKVIKKEPIRLDKEKAFQFAKRNEPHFKLMNAMNFSDLKIIAPALNIYADGVQFFDPGHNEIHLGIDGICDMFKIETREELYNAILYVQGHEEQHRRSTASVPYARAIHRGMQRIIEYIASVEEPKPKRFRNEKDYSDYVNFELRDKGIVLNIKGMQNLIAYIANAIEDGRIERIRAARLPGFAELKLYFRGKFWLTEIEHEPYAELETNPVKKLQALTKEILSLATCQLYSKGFKKAYAGTPFVDEVNDLMPFIARGIMAGSVRKAEPEIVDISGKLAPYIYEAFKLSEKDVEAQKELEKLLADMLKEMIEKITDTGLDERDEDTDDGGADSTFEHSDLVVTLDDETYDKLMEKAKESKSGGGLTIRREHPKEKEEKEEKDSETSGSGSGSDSDKDDEKGESKSGDSKSSDGNTDEKSDDDSDKKSEESGKKSKSKKSKDSDSKDTDTKSSSEGAGDLENAGKDTESSDMDSSSKKKSAADESRDDKEEQKTPEKGSHDTDTDGEADAEKAVESIMKAIEDTKNKTIEEAKTEISHVNEQSGHEKKSMGKPVYDTDPVVTDAEMKDVMTGSGFEFREIKRSYQVDAELPPIVAARGKALHRKMEKYFRSLKSPTIRNLDSGGVDPARLYGLAIGDTDIFRKPGKDKFFDGCAYVLIDNSGSMYGEKFEEACKAAAIIEEGFRGLFPIKIVSFNDNYKTVLHQVVKGWNESLPKNCSWNYRVHSHPDNGNADGCSIAVATKELQKRHEKKKLLVVLSDGAPTEGSRDPIKLTEDAIANARRQHIQVSGIYFNIGSIGPDAEVFKRCYKKDYVCVPLSELDANLTKIFEKFSRS